MTTILNDANNVGMALKGTAGAAYVVLCDISGNPVGAGSNQASELHLGEVGGNEVMMAVMLTRPADVLAYSALDTVANLTSAANLLTFAGFARINAGSGYITKARLMTDQATCTTRFRLHLYHTAPTVINDNVAFAELWTNRANRIGYIDFDACTTEGSGSTAAASLNATARLAFVCAVASTTLYAILQTKDAFTPASAQNFYIELTAERN